MMLVESAAQNPSMLKLISDAVQRARPAMTGNRDRFTQRPEERKQINESPHRLSAGFSKSDLRLFKALFNATLKQRYIYKCGYVCK